MERFTPQQCYDIIKIYYQNQTSIKVTWSGLRARYGSAYPPTEPTIRNAAKLFHNEFPFVRRRFILQFLS